MGLWWGYIIILLKETTFFESYFSTYCNYTTNTVIFVSLIFVRKLSYLAALSLHITFSYVVVVVQTRLTVMGIK